jgi:hypothetical protein
MVCSLFLCNWARSEVIVKCTSASPFWRESLPLRPSKAIRRNQLYHYEDNASCCREAWIIRPKSGNFDGRTWYVDSECVVDPSQSKYDIHLRVAPCPRSFSILVVHNGSDWPVSVITGSIIPIFLPIPLIQCLIFNCRRQSYVG